MPRTQRWSELSHSFSGGIISPAVQDQVDGPAWLAGAADIENMDILRDGGLAGRPPFVRSPHTFVVPRWNGIATGGALDGMPGGLEIVDGRPVIGPNGVYALNARGAFGEEGSSDFEAAPSQDDLKRDVSLYEVDLDPEADVRFVTWHDVRLRRGNWWTPVRGDRRRDENALITLTTEFRHVGVTGWRGAVGAHLTNPLAWRAFAPGQVARDIVQPFRAPGNPRPYPSPRVPMIVPDTPTTSKPIQSVRIRVLQANAARPIELSIGGISCYSTNDTGDANRVWFDRPPVRMISWPVGTVPLVMVLNLYGIEAYQIQGGAVATPPGGAPRATWYFTARQLRELTYVTYGKSLLLFHRDFPYPIRVQLGEGTQLVIDYLPLKNVPEVDLAAIPDATVEIRQREATALPVLAPAVANVPQGYLPPQIARSDGPNVGRPQVAQDVAPIRPQPVIVRRELQVEQRLGEASTPALVAVAPEPVQLSTLVRGMPAAGTLVASWTSTGAASYELFIVPTSVYEAAEDVGTDPWDGITGIPVPGPGVTITHTRTTLQDGTALAGGTSYTVAVRSIIGTAPPSDRSLPSDGIALHTALPVIVTLSAEQSREVQTNLEVAWDAVPDADRYNVQVATYDTAEMEWNDWTDLPTITTTETEITFTGAVIGTRYRFRVQPERANAVPTAFSLPREVEPSDLTLPAPEGFGVSPHPTTSAAIVIVWSPVADATGYDLEHRRVGDTGVTTVNLAAGATTHTITGLTSGLVYEARVRAKTAGSLGRWTPWRRAEARTIDVNIPQPAKPATPTLAQRTAVDGGLRATVASVANATGYRWERRDGTSGAGTALSGSTTSVDFTRPAGTNVQVRVRALRSGAQDGPWSDWSSAVRAYVQPPATPAAPVASAISSTPGGLSATTSAAARATHYDWQAQPSGGSWGSTTRTSGTSVRFTLTGGTAYRVRVRAVRDTDAPDATSSYSGSSNLVTTEQATVTTPPVPSTPSLSAGTSEGALSASVASVGSGVTYGWQSQQEGVSGWTSESGSGTSISLTKTGGVRYRVRVRAERSGATPSGYSTPSGLVRAFAVAPAAPGRPTVWIDTNIGRVNYAWNAVPRATGYVVQRSRNGGAFGSDVTISGGGSGTIRRQLNGLPAGSYRIRIKATRTHAADSAYGPASSAVTPPTLTLAKPSTPSLQSWSAGVGQLRGSVTRVADADAYVWQYQQEGQTSWSSDFQTANPVITLTLTAGTRYRVRVKTRRAGTADSPWSDPSGLARAYIAPLATPGRPTAQIGSAVGSISASWSAVSGATGYDAEYQQSGSTQWRGRTSVSGTSVTFTGLTTGQSYTVRVRATAANRDDSGWSTASNSTQPRRQSGGGGGGGGDDGGTDSGGPGSDAPGSGISGTSSGGGFSDQCSTT